MNKTHTLKRFAAVSLALLAGTLALIGISRIGVGSASAMADQTANVLRQDCPTVGGQLLVYQWDGPATRTQKGFPGFDTDGIGDKTIPASCNTNWTGTPNYAQGMLYFRVKIFSQPVPQNDIKMQFCFWQKNSNESFRRENCTVLNNVPLNQTVQWNVAPARLWKKDGRPILWDRPRTWARSVFKNGNRLPVSDWTQPLWGNENPNDWYPADMCFQVVAVPPGGSAPNWANFPCRSR